MNVVDYKAVYDTHVRSALTDTFGAAVATMIIASATNAARVASVHDLTREDFLSLVDAICDDQRCVDMWGTAGCGDRRQQWRVLV